jgi:hypothetical protein
VGPQQVVAAWRVLKLPGLVVQLVLVPRVQRQLVKEVHWRSSPLQQAAWAVMPSSWVLVQQTA